MKTLIAVAETAMTRAGLLRPGIPYAMDPANSAHAQALREILPEGGPGRKLTADEAAEMLTAGHRPLVDDGALALFDPEADEAADGEAAITIEGASQDGGAAAEVVTGKAGGKASSK